MCKEAFLHEAQLVLTQTLLKMMPILSTFILGVKSKKNETLTFSNITGLNFDPFRSVGRIALGFFIGLSSRKLYRKAPSPLG